ncbi:hypothetical protein [Williamsoniiplasma luminosum]|uniref:hypothetical protein n=1 Tax=Williamsoniiplasma luminosum TaxID=214888 RepID=UPI00047074CB|nr:hypothetical protein [Williamsoniiplasma luminosum]
MANITNIKKEMINVYAVKFPKETLTKSIIGDKKDCRTWIPNLVRIKKINMLKRTEIINNGIKIK